MSVGILNAQVFKRDVLILFQRAKRLLPDNFLELVWGQAVIRRLDGNIVKHQNVAR